MVDLKGIMNRFALGDIIYINNNTYIYIGSKNQFCEEELEKIFYVKYILKDRQFLSYFVTLDKIVETNKLEEVLNHIDVINIRQFISLNTLKNCEYVGKINNLNTFLLKRKMLGYEVPDLNELMDEKVLVAKYKRRIKYLEKKYPKLVSITQGSIVKEGTHKFIYLGIHRIYLFNTNVVLRNLNTEEKYLTSIPMFEKNFDLVEKRHEKIDDVYIDYASI